MTGSRNKTFLSSGIPKTNRKRLPWTRDFFDPQKATVMISSLLKPILPAINLRILYTVKNRKTTLNARIGKVTGGTELKIFSMKAFVNNE